MTENRDKAVWWVGNNMSLMRGFENHIDKKAFPLMCFIEKSTALLNNNVSIELTSDKLQVLEELFDTCDR